MRLPLFAALFLTPLLSVPLAAAPAQDASCQITAGGTRLDGPCLYTPRKGGSFDLRMADGRPIGGARALSLEITQKGRGTLTGDGGQDWGTATRQPDGACWAAEDISLCVRAPGETAPSAQAGDPPPAAPKPVPEPSAADRERSFAARCHMGSCSWFIQGPAHQIDASTTAIAGRRIAVEERSATSEHPGDYPRHAPAGLKWSQATFEVFCSTVRPAFRESDGTWTVLPLPTIGGASEGVSLRYLKACHPGVGDDPYAAVQGLGYSSDDQGFDSYGRFSQLVRP